MWLVNLKHYTCRPLNLVCIHCVHILPNFISNLNLLMFIIFLIFDGQIRLKEANLTTDSLKTTSGEQELSPKLKANFSSHQQFLTSQFLTFWFFTSSHSLTQPNLCSASTIQIRLVWLKSPMTPCCKVKERLFCFHSTWFLSSTKPNWQFTLPYWLSSISLPCPMFHFTLLLLPLLLWSSKWRCSSQSHSGPISLSHSFSRYAWLGFVNLLNHTGQKQSLARKGTFVY